MTQAFAYLLIASYVVEPEVIILNCDDSNAQTYGDQHLTMFNSYYDGYCFISLHIYEGLYGKLITSILKPGRRSKSVCVSSSLRRVILYYRKSLPYTLIIFRGDSRFCSPEYINFA